MARGAEALSLSSASRSAGGRRPPQLWVPQDSCHCGQVGLYGAVLLRQALSLLLSEVGGLCCPPRASQRTVREDPTKR